MEENLFLRCISQCKLIGEKANYLCFNLYIEERYRLNVSSLYWHYDWSHDIDTEDYISHYNYADDDD